MTKRMVVTAITAAGLLAMSACSAEPDSGDTPGGGNTPTSTEDSGQPETPVDLVLSHVLADTHPWQQCGTPAFLESLEASDTGISVDVFSGGQLHGDVLEALDAMDNGNLDMTIATPAQLGTRAEVLSVLDAVYLFRDIEHQQAALASDVADEIWAAVSEKGFEVLGVGYFGTRHVTSNMPVHSPADLAGKKLRVIDSPLWLDNGVALGADPTPISVGELYIALQQGVVDAQENPVAQINSLAIYEIQDYLNLTGHVVGSAMPVISTSSWERLSSNQQAALRNASQALVEAAGQCTEDQEVELLSAWSADGGVIQVNDDIDVAAFQDRARAVLFPKWEAAWGDVYRGLQEIQ